MKRRDFLSLAGYSAVSTMFPSGFALGNGVGWGRSRPDIRGVRDITHFHRWLYPDAPHDGRWELYDFASDRTEMNDLAASNSSKVKEMSGHYESWLDRVGVDREPSS